MKFLTAFGRFWYDFIIGDDWKVAAAVLVGLAITASLVLARVPDGAAALLSAAAIISAWITALFVDQFHVR